MIFLYIIATLAQISPLALFLVFFKRINKIIEIRVVFLYVLTSLAFNFLLGAFQSHATQIIYISAVVEYIFFSAFFYLFIRNKKFRNLIIITTALTVILEIFIFYSSKLNSDFWVTLITTILIVVYSFFFFYEQINSPEILLIYRSYTFWIAVGCIIYLSGTLFLFLYTSDIKDKEKNLLWFINIVFEIVKNIFFSIAFIVARNNQRNIAIENFDDTNILEKPFN